MFIIYGNVELWFILAFFFSQNNMLPFIEDLQVDQDLLTGRGTCTRELTLDVEIFVFLLTELLLKERICTLWE